MLIANIEIGEIFIYPNIIVKVVTSLYWSLNKALTLSTKSFSVCKVKRHSINYVLTRPGFFLSRRCTALVYKKIF